MTELTHFDARGHVHMVDVGGKPLTHRRARAEGTIRMAPNTLDMIVSGGHKKGDVLGIARVAGIMAAKKTAELVPLCHPVSLSKVEIELDPKPAQSEVHCVVIAETLAQTGVEMEALSAVQITLLTIYDMCKAVDRAMCMSDIRLLEKSGGKSGTWTRSAQGDE